MVYQLLRQHKARLFLARTVQYHRRPAATAGRPRRAFAVDSLLAQRDPAAPPPPAPAGAALSLREPPALTAPRGVVHWVYGSFGTLRQEQRLDGLRCPWCNLACGVASSLLMHLTYCHDRCYYRLTVQQG